MKKILMLFLMILPLTGCIIINNKTTILDDFFKDNLSSILFVDDLKETKDKLTINNDVALALELLEDEYNYDLDKIFKNNGTTKSEVKEYYLNKEIDNVYTAYNMCIVYDLLDLDETRLKAYFSSDFAYTEWEHIQIYICLDKLDVNYVLEQEIKTILINSFTDGSYNDADTITMKIMALGDDAPNVALSMLKEYITADGVLGYGDEPSSCSTAYTIIALLCLGEDLCCDYVYNNKNIEQILHMYYVDGGFKNKLTDEEIDYKIATPQCFLALSAIYVSNHDVLELY